MASESRTPEHGPVQNASLLFLTIGAIGVVFGDIGTSPLYAFREALAQTGKDGIGANEIIGVLSLALWSLILVVTVKYVLLLMRADNEGEGGVLALTALARRALGNTSMLVFWLGAAGAALFYGDAIITPALSVLSAVEGLRTIPGIGDGVTEETILGLTVAILVLLFAVQSRGTASVSKLFGPVCILWFVALAGLGLMHIFDEPSILRALVPSYAVTFLLTHGVVGLFVLGAVFLTVTGAEALTADMGHFGVRPIRAAWFALVFPALALNYIGQGAFALAALERAEASGANFENQDWFFLMAPDSLRVPLVILAMLATIIASQAVITGAYSLTRQAIQLGLLPRLKILQTSAASAGQIYLPVVNWLLLIGVLLLVFGFRSSSSMASAYGIAVTGTMVVTTCLAFIVLNRLWGFKFYTAALIVLPFLALDVIFLGANLLRVVQGGWVPIVIALALILVIVTWRRGRGIVFDYERRDSISLVDLASALSRRPPQRVNGTAVFMTANPDLAPGALLHNLKHNKVLHARNLITTVVSANRPVVAEDDRMKSERVDDNFTRVTLRYGFMESPNVPRDLGLEASDQRNRLDPLMTSYFIGRNTLRASPHEGMPLWQDHIFMFLERNASDPTDFFQIPSGKVVELGQQVVV